MVGLCARASPRSQLVEFHSTWTRGLSFIYLIALRVIVNDEGSGR
jgi:hypothetical protein